MKKHFLKLCFLLTVIIALLISCSKEDNGGATPAAIGLTVFKNKTGDVNANTLQAQYKDPKFDIYFYGNFDANNDPTVIKTVTFQKAANDTIMNMTIDPTTFRITSASTTVKGVQQAVVMKFDYLNNATNDFNVSYYSYNWTTQTGQLFYSTLVENNNGVTIGKPNYAARLSGTKTFDYKLALESLVLSTKIVTAGVVVGALLPEAALVTAAAVLIPGIATGWYFNAAVSTLTNLVIGDAKASDFFPPKTLITNPIFDTNTPIPHLPISTCTNTNIVFTATMDATGAIIFTTINGGQAPYTYMVESGFQQSTVFAHNYANGSYLLAVKDANGCVNMKVIPLVRATTPTLVVGQGYQGGFIGYLDGTGQHGLIWNNGPGFQTYWDYANTYCNNLVYDGYADWHLPSLDEWNQLQGGSTVQLIGVVFPALNYWGSNMNSAGNYFFIFPGTDLVHTGSYSGYVPGNTDNVFFFPIRSF